MSLTKFPNGVDSFVIPKNATDVSASFTATANTVYAVTASITITLPAIATGNSFTFYNAGERDGLVEITIDPNASDGIALGGSATDGVTLVNTLATAKRGDFVTLASGDQGVFWFPTAMQGVWAKGS
jgi:hypothetical protein